MKKHLLILTALFVLSLTSCQKEYNFKDKDALNLKGRAADDPDTPQPGWTNLTTVILYSSYQFDFSWSYQYIIGGNAGAYWAIGNPAYVVHGGAPGHTITKFPVASSVLGNVATFVIHIQDNYMVLIPSTVLAGEHSVYDDVIMTIKFDMITKVYTVKYSTHTGIFR